jgi:hypothetical protein
VLDKDQSHHIGGTLHLCRCKTPLGPKRVDERSLQFLQSPIPESESQCSFLGIF